MTAILAGGFVLQFLLGWHRLARVGRVWRALAHWACLPSPTGMVGEEGSGEGRHGTRKEGVGCLARMVPPPIGGLVRAGDEDSGRIGVFGVISRVFCGGGGLRLARHGRAPGRG